MNWSKTKTIFIICFLLVDIFLGYQMYQRQAESQKQILNFEKNSLTESIENNNIGMPPDSDLPSMDQKMFFLTGTFTNFEQDSDAKKAVKTIAEQNKNVSFSISANGQILNATFDTSKKQIKVPKTNTEMQDFLKAFVYKGQDYKPWPFRNDKDKVIHFIQMFNNNPLFSVSVDNGQLYTLNVYTHGDVVTGYQQILMDASPSSPVKVSMSPKEAVQILAENYLQISHNPDVNDIELGYINLASDINESRELPYVLAWFINVKTDEGNRSFFITMFGKVYENVNGEKDSGDS